MTPGHFFNIEHTDSDERWELALEMIDDPNADTVAYRGMGLWLDRRSTGEPDSGLLTVAVQSTWQAQNVTEARARDDPRGARKEIGELIGRNDRFRTLCQARRLEYLLLDDYGMGAVHISLMCDDELIWFEPFPAA